MKATIWCLAALLLALAGWQGLAWNSAEARARRGEIEACEVFSNIARSDPRRLPWVCPQRDQVPILLAGVFGAAGLLAVGLALLAGALARQEQEATRRLAALEQELRAMGRK